MTLYFAQNMEGYSNASFSTIQVQKQTVCPCGDALPYGDGLVWQGFGGHGSRGGICEKCPLCQIEPAPAGSKTDTARAKAEASSKKGRASGIMDFRKMGKKLQQISSRERSENT